MKKSIGMIRFGNLIGDNSDGFDIHLKLDGTCPASHQCRTLCGVHKSCTVFFSCLPLTGFFIAMEIAIAPSVTVSIGQLLKGVFRTTLRVIRPFVATSDPAKSVFQGRDLP
jgi:hypothetical protein